MSEIRCPLSIAAENHGERTALVTSGRLWTYRQLDHLVTRTQAWLRFRGVMPGDRVAIALPNGAEYIALVVALFRTGATACLLNPSFPEVLLAKLLRSIECRLAVFDETRLSATRLSGISFLPLSDLAGAVGPDEGSGSPQKSLHEDPRPTIVLGRAATILTTAGSTAIPKAVVHTYGNHHYSALGANEAIPLNQGDRWLLSLPLYHVGGLGILFRCVPASAAIVLVPEDGTLAGAIDNLGVSHVSLVPTQLYRLLRDQGFFPRGLQNLTVLVGGGPLPTSLIREAIRQRIRVFTTYGLTEMGSQVTTGPVGERTITNTAGHLAPAGRPLRYRELAISDEGEILVRGETLALGYYKDGALADLTDDDGWFHTGDIGAIDENGCLRLSGRRDTMIISGGENIYPEAIEAVLMSEDAIQTAVVVGVNDEEFGQRPVAFVKAGPGQEIDVDALTAHMGGRLPRYMRPVGWFELPAEAVDYRLKPDRAYLKRLGQELYDRALT